MGDVIDFNARKKASIESGQSYQDKISKLDKFQLLEEMVNFQEERSKVKDLTPELMINGKILFDAILALANTSELKTLASSYSRHLKIEYDNYLKRGK